MYIMAAVDVDVREATKAAKARAAASGGSRWKRGEGDGGVQVHEQVICSIKAHQNGTLEIAPGKFRCSRHLFCTVACGVLLVSPTCTGFTLLVVSGCSHYRMYPRVSLSLTVPHE